MHLVSRGLGVASAQGLRHGRTSPGEESEVSPLCEFHRRAKYDEAVLAHESYQMSECEVEWRWKETYSGRRDG